VKVLVFGSSIAEGYWATRGRWVQQSINDVAPFGIDHGQGGRDPVRVAHAVEVAGQAADVAVARVTAGRPSK
jgi:hypothetical protein